MIYSITSPQNPQVKICSSKRKQSVSVSIIGYPPSGAPVPFGYINPDHRKALVGAGWRFEAVER